ncbi:MAG: amino acid ABC transporter permease [Syntrophomonadaceae bacterium]|mgnify:CR=1 FL=1|nr:amino acid ABC transporter permease [Syntrophomonadaceae bacterium]
MEYLLILIPSLLEGTALTLKFFFITLVISLPLGMIGAVARISKFRPLNIFMQFYIWVFRGTPLLLQVLFVYFGLWLQFGITLDQMTAALLAFILNYAAYLAEVFRSGIQSIDRGQFEAADVLGLSRFQTMKTIIMPQMFKRVLPPVSNEVINLIKDTALIYAIGITELLRAAKIAAVRDFVFTPFLVAAVFYLIMTAVIQLFFKWLEAKNDYYH